MLKLGKEWVDLWFSFRRKECSCTGARPYFPTYVWSRKFQILGHTNSSIIHHCLLWIKHIWDLKPTGAWSTHLWIFLSDNNCDTKSVQSFHCSIVHNWYIWVWRNSKVQQESWADRQTNMHDIVLSHKYTATYVSTYYFFFLRKYNLLYVCCLIHLPAQPVC